MTGAEPVRRRVAVVGGGISGLSAAYTLARARRDGAPIEELLIEAADRLGGVIRTERVEDFVIEAGPDSFLAEKPQAAALARELGLGDELLGSNDHQRRTYILRRGRLVPLPDGLMFLVPTRIWPMVTTPLLSARAKLAIAAEWFTLPHDARAEDESVASFVRRHFGEEMTEVVADPLLAGVYGGGSAGWGVMGPSVNGKRARLRVKTAPAGDAGVLGRRCPPGAAAAEPRRDTTARRRWAARRAMVEGGGGRR